jgi:hypothetical protein
MSELSTLMTMMRNGVTGLGDGFDSVDDDWHPVVTWIDPTGGLRMMDLDEAMREVGKTVVFGLIIPALIEGATAAVVVASAFAIEGQDLEEQYVRPSRHPRRHEQVHVIGVDRSTQVAYFMDVHYDEAGIRKPGSWLEYKRFEGFLVDALLTIRED